MVCGMLSKLKIISAFFLSYLEYEKKQYEKEIEKETQLIAGMFSSFCKVLIIHPPNLNDTHLN